MAQRGKQVWRGLCLVDEVRVVPLPGGRCEVVLGLRDDVVIKDQPNVAGDKGKGGEDDD
jgi:hypothetical protein